MAIKAGQILHVANQFVVDRIQTGGAGQLNIPQTKVYELGNYRSVGIVRDIPDLTFSLECLDTDTEVEALLTGSTDPLADANGTAYELSKAKAIDIISPWKTPYGEFVAVHGVAVPYLALESASYRYGLTDNGGETFSLRGDSIYYVPGTPWQDLITGADLAAGDHDFQHGPALEYHEGGATRFALSVTVNGERLVRGTNYTDTATGITFQPGYVPAGADVISVTYGSADDATYPQLGQDPFGSGDGHLVHQGTSIKPAAIRGKDIDVYFSTSIPMTAGAFDPAGTPTAVEVRWPDVQSATVDWSVTLEADEEFGNHNAVSREATDVPNVTGAIEIKPRSVQAFYTRLRQITGVNELDRIIGPSSSLTGALRIELRNPESGGSTAVAPGTPLKTHYVPAARFTMPGYTGTVQQKLTTTLNYESDDGVLKTYKGARS